jgi:hypothetical protein
MAKMGREAATTEMERGGGDGCVGTGGGNAALGRSAALDALVVWGKRNFLLE